MSVLARVGGVLDWLGDAWSKVFMALFKAVHILGFAVLGATLVFLAGKYGWLGVAGGFAAFVSGVWVLCGLVLLALGVLWILGVDR